MLTQALHKRFKHVAIVLTLFIMPLKKGYLYIVQRIQLENVKQLLNCKQKRICINIVYNTSSIKTVQTMTHSYAWREILTFVHLLKQAREFEQEYGTPMWWIMSGRGFVHYS